MRRTVIAYCLPLPALSVRADEQEWNQSVRWRRGHTVSCGSPSLSRFCLGRSMGGGQPILWHGLADPRISPLNTIAYYTAMTQMTGEPSVQQFSRLYLFPDGFTAFDHNGRMWAGTHH